MVISAVLPPVRSISCSVLTTRIAPVAPTVWPSATAPPLGLTRPGSKPGAGVTALACAAEAWFKSTNPAGD